MLVATVMAAPVHGERLVQVDEAPALAVRGVRKVVKLANAVAVVADGYWAARRPGRLEAGILVGPERATHERDDRHAL